jgi:DNA-binding NtrC family response regulator
LGGKDEGLEAPAVSTQTPFLLDELPVRDVRHHPADHPLQMDSFEDKGSFVNAEIIPDNLSLQEKEKEMIAKALLKNNGRRKDTAVDFGISERTLYRKLKEYQLDIK